MWRVQTSIEKIEEASCEESQAKGKREATVLKHTKACNFVFLEKGIVPQGEQQLRMNCKSKRDFYECVMEWALILALIHRMF
jgi:hypothetical protein